MIYRYDNKCMVFGLVSQLLILSRSDFEVGLLSESAWFKGSLCDSYYGVVELKFDGLWMGIKIK